jgi:Phosphatidylinositol-4-phosphate 5-Kinase
LNLNSSLRQVLIELAPSYFRYIDATASKATVLAKLVGFYTIEIKNLETGTVQSKADLLVTENLFYDRNISKTFDLKGIQGRKVKPHASGKTSKTLFDGEWIEGNIYYFSFLKKANFISHLFFLLGKANNEPHCWFNLIPRLFCEMALKVIPSSFQKAISWITRMFYFYTLFRLEFFRLRSISFLS